MFSVSLIGLFTVSPHLAYTYNTGSGLFSSNSVDFLSKTEEVFRHQNAFKMISKYQKLLSTLSLNFSGIYLMIAISYHESKTNLLRKI